MDSLSNMDVNSIKIRLLLAVSVFNNSVHLLTLKTEDVIFKESDSIILNCTYHKDNIEHIIDTYIRWQKLIGKEFKDIALFSPPGGLEPFIAKNMQHLYSNRTDLIAPYTSFSAVMIIKEPLCNDQGVYQCWIDYFSYSDGLSQIQTSRSIVEFKAKAREPETFLLFPNELEENQFINMICNADVGSPQGTIMIWKNFQNNDTLELIYASKDTTNQTESCTEFRVNVTYTVTRDDNGALFRCSSQNNFTRGPGPYRDSLKIAVIYGPEESDITLTPSKYLYVVGDPLTIQCIADSNPPPVFVWSFRPLNTWEKTLIEHVHVNSKLVFDSLQTTDSGTYICTAINTARPNYPNASSSVSLYIRHSESNYNGCEQCGYFQICQQYNRDTECVTNKWAQIAVVFIIVCVSFAVTTIILIINKKNRSTSITSSKSVYPRGDPQNDRGYQTHADFANTHVYSSLQSHKPETSEYTSLQSHKPETSEYTSLQPHNPTTSEYTSLQSHKPETSEYTSLQSHKLENSEYTSLQSHKPETGHYTSLQSQKQTTAEYTSLQPHNPTTDEYTSLQSQKPKTGEYTSLQSHKPETGEYTTIDNVS